MQSREDETNVKCAINGEWRVCCLQKQSVSCSLLMKSALKRFVIKHRSRILLLNRWLYSLQWFIDSTAFEWRRLSGQKKKLSRIKRLIAYLGLVRTNGMSFNLLKTISKVDVNRNVFSFRPSWIFIRESYFSSTKFV